MQLKLWQAINTALRDTMAEDEHVIVLGQDVGAPGGPFGLTRGLIEDFGPDRVRDTPISEAALAACGTGAALMGLRPVVEIMFFDFAALCLGQLVNQTAKFRFFTQGKTSVPLVIHTLYGGRANFGAQHSQSIEAWLGHVPGLKVAFPSTPQDAYGVLRAAMADPDPTVVINSIALLRESGQVDTSSLAGFEAGTARLVAQGDQLTVVSYGPSVHICEEALSQLGVDADLIDLRWMQPWNERRVCQSVRRTGRLLVVHDAVETGGWGGELVARLAAEEFWNLDAPPMRIGAAFSPVPVARRDWEPLLPNVERVQTAVRELLSI